MLRKRNDVGETLAQRRQMQGNDMQPVKEILAECPLAYALAQIAMGRRNDAHVDRDSLAAHWRHHALLKRAKDFGLHGQTHVADFVEEQRSTRSLAEGALAISRCAREGAPHMSE